MNRTRRARLSILVAGLAGVGVFAHEAVPATDAAGFTVASAAASPESGVVRLDKSAQRQLGLRTATLTALASARVAVPGRVLTDPLRAQRIAATQAGTIEALPGQNLPAPGTRIVAGQVLARLRPVLPQPDRRDLETDLAEADRDTKIGELQIERFHIDDTNQFDVKLPTPTLQILTDYHAAQVRQASLNEALKQPLPLTASHSGTLLRSLATSGRLVAEGETLFEISPDAGAQVIDTDYIDNDLDAARAVQARTRSGRSLSVQLVGTAVFDAGTRSTRARYAITDEAAPVTVNEPVTVFVPHAAAADSPVALPSSAVMRRAGRAVVWLHTDAEQFVAQPVALLSDDGETARVRAAWMSPVVRIVVQGAAALGQGAAALSSK